MNRKDRVSEAIEQAVKNCFTALNEIFNPYVTTNIAKEFSQALHKFICDYLRVSRLSEVFIMQYSSEEIKEKIIQLRNNFYDAANYGELNLADVFFKELNQFKKLSMQKDYLWL